MGIESNGMVLAGGPEGARPEAGHVRGSAAASGVADSMSQPGVACRVALPIRPGRPAPA